jgi:hypothetical protein
LPQDSALAMVVVVVASLALALVFGLLALRRPGASPHPVRSARLSPEIAKRSWQPPLAHLWPASLFLSRKDAIPVVRPSLDLELPDPPPVEVVDRREMACRGEQALIEEAQRRGPILSPVSPQQRRMPVDELRLLDLFRGSVYTRPAWLLPLTATRSISINSGSSSRAAVSAPPPVLPALSGWDQVSPTPIKLNLSRPQPPTSAQLPCNYGDHMVDRLSSDDGSVGSAYGKSRHVTENQSVGRMQSAGWSC